MEVWQYDIFSGRLSEDIYEPCHQCVRKILKSLSFIKLILKIKCEETITYHINSLQTILLT